jgi:hypothetical protein
LLVASIQSSSISTPLSYLEREGSGPSMSVLVWFSDALSSNDQTTLNSLMSSYVNELPQTQQNINQILKDMSFGISIIAQFGAANRAAGLNVSQVIQISQQLASIQSLLMSGSITTALTVIQSIQPSALLTQETLNSYITQMQNYLSGET